MEGSNQCLVSKVWRHGSQADILVIGSDPFHPEHAKLSLAMDLLSHLGNEGAQIPDFPADVHLATFDRS